MQESDHTPKPASNWGVWPTKLPELFSRHNVDSSAQQVNILYSYTSIIILYYYIRAVPLLNQINSPKLG